jgi:MFS family permease
LHATSRTRGRAAGVAGAYIFFASLYFVQSVGDPTSGLIAQPVRSLLKSWGESPAALGALMALLAVPWTIKPIFGLLSDFVPLFGSRRRNYLLLANGLAALSLLLLAFVPIEPGSLWWLFALLLPTTMAIALGDVIVDALMVEKGPATRTDRALSIHPVGGGERGSAADGSPWRLCRRGASPVARLCFLRGVVVVRFRSGVALLRRP